jgi:hypothetical protein
VFSAAYVYHLPQGSESAVAAARKVQQYRQQFGLTIDPILLWNLTPWSWLIDWLLPIGDFIASMQELVMGNTVVPWAFISEHTQIVDTYERPGCVLKDNGGVGTFTVTSDYKRRLHAHPLGFGVTWEGLSPKQVAILAAIGVTR